MTEFVIDKAWDALMEAAQKRDIKRALKCVMWIRSILKRTDIQL